MGSSNSEGSHRRRSFPSNPVTESPATPTIRQAPTALPSDVLVIVFSWACETTSLSTLRVVSRQFDDLIVPIIYEKVALNARIVDCFRQSSLEHTPVQRQIAKDICVHARHVSIGTELHWPSVLRLLYSLDNLRELTISYWLPSPDTESSIHYSVFTCSQFRARWPKLRLHVEKDDDSTAIPFYALISHATNVVSCTTTINTRQTDWSDRAATIKNALIANPQLETLHLKGRGKVMGDVGWDESDTRKLPPVKKLFIRNLLGWNLFSICDWSNITSLALLNVSNLALVEGFPPEKLSQLKTLFIACRCWDPAGRQKELQVLSVFLNTLVGSSRNLRNLLLMCGIHDLHPRRRGCSLTFKSPECRGLADYLPALTQTCQSLSRLHLHNSIGPQSLPWRWIMLSAIDLDVINCSCPGLMDLSLDAEITLHGGRPRLDINVTAALATFRNLRRLTVHTLMPYSRPEAGLPPHHQARAVAREWIENVQRLKQGARFEKLTVDIDIERLVAEDEFQRVEDDDEWWVDLKYTFEVGKGVHWSVTGEERCLEFLRR